MPQSFFPDCFYQHLHLFCFIPQLLCTLLVSWCYCSVSFIIKRRGLGRPNKSQPIQPPPPPPPPLRNGFNIFINEEVAPSCLSFASFVALHVALASCLFFYLSRCQTQSQFLAPPRNNTSGIYQFVGWTNS